MAWKRKGQGMRFAHVYEPSGFFSTSNRLNNGWHIRLVNSTLIKRLSYLHWPQWVMSNQFQHWDRDLGFKPNLLFGNQLWRILCTFHWKFPKDFPWNWCFFFKWDEITTKMLFDDDFGGSLISFKPCFQKRAFPSGCAYFFDLAKHFWLRWSTNQVFSLRITGKSYPSSQNHGSGKWVPPILVSFHLG